MIISDTKKQILYEAGLLFYKHGFNNTGIEKITTIVGIKKPALYYHFASKNVLGLAYLENQANLLFVMLDSLCEQAKSYDQYLSRWATTLIVLARRSEFYGCPFTAFASELDEMDRNYFEKKLRQIESEWLTKQEEVINKFYPNLRNKKEIAKKILILHTGCVILYRASRNEKYLKQMKKDFGELALGLEGSKR